MTSRTLAVLLLFVSATALSAQKPPVSGEAMSVHPEARAAIDHLWSPYCPGMMLDVCTSTGGAMMRDSIQRMAESGMSSEAIVESMLAEYGQQWRAEPLRSGTGLWAWLLPPVVIVVGLGAVAVVLARRRGITEVVSEPQDVAPDDEARLRAALKDLEQQEEPVF